LQVRLPSPNRIKDPDIKDYLNQLVQGLERAFDKVGELPRTKNRIVITNVSVSAGYTFNSSAATLDEVRQVLTALIRDLQISGEIA